MTGMRSMVLAAVAVVACHAPDEKVIGPSLEAIEKVPKSS